jgi:multiple sugar transport system permease protein
VNWRGWAGGVAAAAIIAAALTLGVTRGVQNRYERDFAFRMARTTAKYITTVTPAPPPPAPPRPTRPPARRPAVRAPAPPRAQSPAPASRGYHLPQLLTNARALRTIPGWTSEVEVYHGTAPLVDATAPPLTTEDLVWLDSADRSGDRWRGPLALVPLRDHDGREVVGAVGVRPRTLPRGPLPGGLGFVWPAALLAVVAAGVIAFRQHSLRRGGYAVAALLLAVAGYADVRFAARQTTDRWLADTRRLLQEAASRLPPPRTRAVSPELVALVDDAEIVPGDPGESPPRRLRIDGRRRAVAAVLIGPGRWVELRTVPAEDATVGWGIALLACAFLGPMAIWGVRWAERTPARQRRETAIAWGFLAPTALHLAAFTIAPLLLSLYLALHSSKAFVGLTNFKQVLGDPLTWSALRNTAVYALYVPVSAVVALLAALWIDARRNQASGRISRLALLLPYTASVVAIALVWQLIFRSRAAGLGEPGWLSDPAAALLAIMLISIWAATGGQTMLLLAGLERIPRGYVDGARIDGASRWRAFWRVTFPLLRPVIGLALITGLISALQLFTLVYVLTAGGPAEPATQSVAYRIYSLSRAPDGVGPASALALLLFLLLAAVTWTQWRVLRRQAPVA